jgi:hypothetical protein
VQIAATDLAAIESGEFLAVIGDFHPGNPLAQGLFSTRFPDPARLRELWHADVGQPVLVAPVRRNPKVRVTARNTGDITTPDDIHVLGARSTPAPLGHRAVRIADMTVRGDEVVDRAGSFRAPLAELFTQPMFVAAARTFQPFPDTGPRLTVGRTVLRRASWLTRAAEQPRETAGLADWARELGLPRRVFCRPSGEPKPVYVDFQSAALTRNLHRMLGRAAATDPDATVRFSEMLPNPDQCWLEHQGSRYTSELRLVAVDRTRRAHGALVTHS